MLEKPSLTDQRIIDGLNTAYGIKVATLTLLPLGADLNASVYKAQTHDKTSYFIKLKRGHHHDISTILIALLHNAGMQHIIFPIKTKHGLLTQHIDDFTMIVSPFIEGENGFCRDLTNNQWLTLGKVMRQVHEMEVPSSILSIIRREVYSSKWRETVRALYAHIDSEPSGDEIAIELLKFMKKHATAIHKLVDRAEQLSEQIRDHTEFVLCHSDIHGGNVLINENDMLYIVDWDEPIMAPKERDLMFIGGGVANVWNKPHEEELFYKGYGKVVIDKTILAYYRHERIVEDIAILGQQLLLSTQGGQDRMEWYQHFIAQFELNGVVDIAFKTDVSKF